MEKTICENPRTAPYIYPPIRSLNNSPDPQPPLLGELGYSKREYLEKLDESYLELAEVCPELKNHSLKAAARPKRNFAFKANWGHLHKRLPQELRSWFRPGKIVNLLRQPQWTERYTYDLRGNITA